MGDFGLLNWCVLAAYMIATLAKADAGNVFMWGHSLGGEVTLKALLATERVKATSIWSPVGGDIWEQAYNYSTRGASRDAYAGSDHFLQGEDRLRAGERDVRFFRALLTPADD